MYHKFNKESLIFEKTFITDKILLGFGVFVGLLFILGFKSNPINEDKYLSQEDKIILIREFNEFSEEKLVKKIKELTLNFHILYLHKLS
jgi:hypothetical protein